MKLLNARKYGFTLFLIFLSVLIFAPKLFAELPPFKIYTTEEGLAHDRVNKIVRDSRGFLWFCTAEGLSRFDGSRFKNYTQDNGLPHREVYDFLETKDGTYLVATNGGLAVFNPNGKTFRWNILESRLEQTDDEPPLFQTFLPNTNDQFNKIILSLAQDGQGRIWAGAGRGLFQVEKVGANDWRFREIEYQTPTDKNFGYGIFVSDADGGLLVGSTEAIFKMFPDGGLKKLLPHGARSIFRDRDGRIWSDNGTTLDGLKVYSYENDSLRLIKTYTKQDGLPADGFYFALQQTSDGRIYVGMHAGLCEFLPDAKENEPKFRRLGTDKVTALALDSGGNLWIGTELKGAWKLARSGFTIFGEKDGFGEKDDIRSIYFDRKDNLILSIRPGKILQFADGKFQSITPLGLTARSWSWHFLDVQAKDGEWWIPSAKGLLRYPKVANAADLVDTPPKKLYTTADGLPGNEIFNLFEDSRGDLWFSIVNVDNSLMRWERKTEKFINYTFADGLPKNNGPISFAEDLHGNIWFGHYFGGLARYRNGKFDFFTAKDGLPETLISDLMIDSAGRLWIGTSGFGVFRIDQPSEEKPIFVPFSTADGLSSNQTICFTQDRFKRIYIGTGRGINRLDTNGKVRLFTQADGLPSNYITRCAADKNGALWFVSQNTLVKFAPEIEQSSIPPPVFIDKVSVNGVPQKISVLGETEIELPEFTSNRTQIQIDFFALTFGTGENIRYQYRLDGQDWSNSTDQQTLNLDLATGRHSFEVRAILADGVTGDKSAITSFKILPPIWARWWFIALCVLAIVLIVAAFYRYRLARLREINAALEETNRAEENLRKSREERLVELEKVRSRIATDLHDDIGASLTQIAILSEVAQAQSKNGVSEPLKKITDVSNELVGTMSDIVWSINPQKDHLSDLIQRMRRFASDSLSAKGIVFHFNSPPMNDDIPIGTNMRREVFLIFKESINNIVKHSSAKRVEIEFGISDKELNLRIVDDGKGFEAEKTFENSLSSIEMGGNGILSMKKRAAEMNGSFEIISANGKGTETILKLPLDAKSNFSQTTQAGGNISARKA